MSTADGTSCPKCEKSNPVGAKFCSGCATSLGTGANPQPPPNPPLPPPPPPRPGGGHMMGSFGGKSTSRQFEAEANDLFAAAIRFVEGEDGSEIKHQAPPQQVSASVIFKEFLTTLSAPIKVDSEIQITPTAPGQCSVAINSKVDWSSTTSIWMITVAMVVFMMFLNPFLIMMWFLIGALGSALNVWMLSSRAPNKVADDLFSHLRKHASEASAAPVQQNVVNAPPTPPAPAPTPVQKQEVVEEEEPMERIKKLAELKELGAITSDEFEMKKAELLKRI